MAAAMTVVVLEARLPLEGVEGGTYGTGTLGGPGLLSGRRARPYDRAAPAP